MAPKWPFFDPKTGPGNMTLFPAFAKAGKSPHNPRLNVTSRSEGSWRVPEVVQKVAEMATFVSFGPTNVILNIWYLQRGQGAQGRRPWAQVCAQTMGEQE